MMYSRKRRRFAGIRLTAALALMVAIAYPAQRAFAQQPDAFVREVLTNNPSLRARASRTMAAERSASSLGLWPDPALSVMLDNVPERELGEMPMLRYQLSQMLPWPGKLDLMQRAGLRRAQSAKADVETRRHELTREAKRAYLMLVLNARRREVLTASTAVLKTVVGSALARYGAGTAGHHEVVRAQAELAATEIETIELQGERSSVVEMMNALRNAPPGTEFTDPAGEPQPARLATLNVLIRRALTNRPELRGMAAMRQEELLMASLARRERYPDLMTGVWYNQMLGSPDTIGVMLGATLPVFGVRRQNRTAESAELRARAVADDAAAMAAMIRFEVVDALRRFETARKAAEFIGSAARPRAQDSFASSLAAYATGTVDMVAVLEAWRALQQVELALAEASVAMAAAEADLERAVAGRVAP